jgi:hypothetical protein
MAGSYFWSEWPQGLKLFYVAVFAEPAFGLAVALWAGTISGTVPLGNYWVVGISTIAAAGLGITGHHMASSLGRWGVWLYWCLSFVAAVIGAVKYPHM